MANLAAKSVRYGTGRRKASVARVYLKPGKGLITVNDRALDEYFGPKTAAMIVKQPLVATEMTDRFDVVAFVKGGGTSGQAGAVRLGIARALIASSQDDGEGDGESALRPILRKAGYLTRDARCVERKKVGRHKARKGTQYSKR